MAVTLLVTFAVMGILDAALAFSGAANLAATIGLWLRGRRGAAARRARRVGHLHPAGLFSVGTTALARLVVLGWFCCVVASAPLPPEIRTVLGVLTVAVALGAPLSLIDNYLLQEVLCRDTWPAAPTRSAAPRRGGPMVSVHVPCYAEPPDVVIGTLDALAAQFHREFEVLVIDNNTKDERLWRPVEQRCRELGERFRFCHVDPLAGAKAGALNYALERTAPQAELVAVVDADYQASPHFLSSLVGRFDEERLAFVQTRHDYRDWQGSDYLRACFWEYRVMYSTYMVSRSAWNAALTTGTICVVRRHALEAVGGWAQWCTTEDSELAVRLYAAGFTGGYVSESLGYGLIPESFAGYRRQRFRWIYGPTQEFRRHWRLFLPGRLATPSHLTPVQKLLLAHHGLRELVLSMSDVVSTLCVAVLAVVWSPHAPAGLIPVPVFLGLIAMNLAGPLLTWCVLRDVMGCSRAEASRATLARIALSGITQGAGLAGWLSTSGTFQRTSKFRVLPDRAGALRATAPESLLGLATLALACAVVVRAPGDGLDLLLGLCLLAQAQSWLISPFMALLAERRPAAPAATSVPQAVVPAPRHADRAETLDRSVSP